MINYDGSDDSDNDNDASKQDEEEEYLEEDEEVGPEPAASDGKPSSGTKATKALKEAMK